MIFPQSEFFRQVRSAVDERLSNAFDDAVSVSEHDDELRWTRARGYVRLWVEGERTFHVGAYDADRAPRQPYHHGQIDDLGVGEAADAVVTRLAWFGP